MSVAVAPAPARSHPASVQARIRTLADLPGYIARTHVRPTLLLRCTPDGAMPCATRRFAETVRALGLALRAMGIASGDRVAIMSETRQEWLLADLGILTARGVTVPVYPTLSAQQARYILQDSGARGVFVSDARQAEKILDVLHLLPALEFIVVFAEDPPAVAVKGARAGPDNRLAGRSSVLRFADVEQRGRTLFPDARAVAEYDAGVDAAQPGDLLTIIYTSGTTGEPKGVMLTHENLLSNMLAVSPILQLTSSDVALSYLPLSHVFERMVTYVYLYEGVTVAHAESLDTLGRDLQTVRPTVMTGVPRVYEKLHARILEAVGKGPAYRRRLFEWASRIGRDVSTLRNDGRPVPALLKMQEAVADGLVAAKIRARVGGRLRLAVSGSAALPAHIGVFFHSMGLRLIEGYGLTETSPVVTVNPLDRPRLGTVGCVIDGVDVRIAEDGEILTRGPNVMRGYWQRPEDTAQAIVGGWLHTGDIGTLSADGYLSITDRKKELLVTSGGKKIAPAPIEGVLKQHPLVAEAMVVGEGRRFPAVLIVPDFPVLEQRLQRLGFPEGSREELIERRDVRSLYQEVVDALNHDLAQYERLKKIALLSADFSIAGGELTPTMKLRRKVVLDRWQSVVDRLYEEA